MKRVHVLEFEDLPWFPGWLRACMTNVLVVFSRKMGVTDVVGRLVARAVKEAGVDRVVDLGSGGGGPMPEVIEGVRRRPETGSVELLMTDRFPSPDAVERFAGPGPVRYSADPVDATDLAAAPPGLKTMVNCFHHMRPPQARAILESAHRARQPLLVYELADNEIPFPVWLLFLPVGLLVVFLMALALTPAVRPLRARQLVFTYLVPLVPLFYAWDGQASMPRIYTLGDLDELLEGLHTDDYVWEKGHATTESGRKLGIYLLGLPR